MRAPTSLDPTLSKLERFELFSTQQAYYIVACDKNNNKYRVLKIDRTLIPSNQEQQHVGESNTTEGSVSSEQQNTATTSPGDGPSLDSIENSVYNNRPLSSFCVEDPHVYNQEEIQEMLDMIHNGNKNVGGLRPICKAYGIVGIIRFLDCYYLTLITKRVKVGSIGGCAIYSIKSTETFPLKAAEMQSSRPGSADSNMNVGGGADPSSMLLSLWNHGKRSVGLGLTNREIAELRYQGLYQVIDMSKNFFFSYNYDMTRSLQDNFLSFTSKPFPPPPQKDMFSWNFFLTRELEECTTSLTSSYWILPIVHGAFSQRKINDYGRTLNLTLMARRSRHFAGTRYLKRGVSDRGKVANDVEHEQILHDETLSGSKGTFSSFIQMRASIPTYWTQESSVTMPKPPIILNRIDPTYKATQAHFEDLMKRYGSPIVVVDLVKQSEKREREVIVGNEYRHAIEYLNTYIDETHKIRYCSLDYSHVSKHRNLNVSTSLNEVATWAVNQTGFFCSLPRWKITKSGIEPFTEEDCLEARLLSEHLAVPVFPMEQKGVLRTNCIDCLDRTNVAQFSAGVGALAQQLVVMGIRSSVKLDPASNIVRVLIDMYVEIGDHISLQYGGSEAHKKVESGGADLPAPLGKHKELLTSIRRYYSNAFTDRLKQDAMNLFLGYYVPSRHTVPLWELENDYHLHNFHVKVQSRGAVQAMKRYQKEFALNLDVDENEVEEESFVEEMGQKKTICNSTSTRMAAVKNKFRAQIESLSLWWKVAIQCYIQQRMWMRIGSPAEYDESDSFERIYQPDKLTQFDKYFARAWSMPSRLSHEASLAIDDLAGHKKNTTNKEYLQSIDEAVQADESEEITLNRFIQDLVPKEEGNFMTDTGTTPILPSKNEEYLSSVHFLGDINSNATPCEKYIKYANDSSLDADYSYDPTRAREEFTKYIKDTDLDSNDVEGIRRLTDSAYISQQIKFGPYRGLYQDVSAVDVTIAVHEQFNNLMCMKERGVLQDGLNSLDATLASIQMDTPGIKETIGKGWEKLSHSENQFVEVLGDELLKCRRSKLTSDESLRLYASFFDSSTSVSNLEKAYISGQSQTPTKDLSSNSNDGMSEEAVDNCVDCLRRCDNNVQGKQLDSKNVQDDDVLPIPSHIRRDVRPEFEQINEDLFAKRDNKFIVFNGKGVDCWHGIEPITRLSSIREDFPMLSHSS